MYLNPPKMAVVLSVDEKGQVQALARSQPAFPMMPGMCEKRTHDYLRHSTTSQIPEHLDVHLDCDNYGTHKSPAIQRWLQAHPRFHMHYTPTYSSWINQVERWVRLPHRRPIAPL